MVPDPTIHPNNDNRPAADFRDVPNQWMVMWEYNPDPPDLYSLIFQNIMIKNAL